MDLVTLIWALLLDTSASWLRMFVALAVSMLVSLAVGIWAARSEKAGRVILPIIDILQTLPILAFFPFVIYIVITIFPAYLGINAAVIFLIITSMLWNMIFGVYEAIKTLPGEFTDVASLYKMGGWQKITKIYIPAAMPKLIQQSVLSWSIGLFYLVTSEIFSTGSASYTVTHGIGVALTQLALSGSYVDYVIGLAIFIIFVIATRFLIFVPLERHYEKPNKVMATKVQQHKMQGISMRSVRLFREIENLYRKNFERSALKSKRGEEPNLEPIFDRELAEMHRQRRIRWSFYFVVLLLLVAAFLITTGTINPTTIYYEEMSLIALAFSFVRVWLTFLVILAVAVPVCVYLIFISKRAGSYLTLFQILASIPATIVLPIIVVALANYPAHSELVAFSVFFLSGIWYVIFSSIADAKSLQSSVFEVKKLFKVKGLNAWKNIYVKAIAPGIITGAVTGIAAEWNASIVAEYFTSAGIGGNATTVCSAVSSTIAANSPCIVSAVNVGMGRLLDTSLASGNLSLMLIALINLTVMIILIDTFVWKKLYKRVSDVYK